MIVGKAMVAAQSNINCESQSAQGSDSEAISCFLCGERSNRIVVRESTYVGKVCGSCQLLYTDPHPSPGTVDPTEELHPEEFCALPARFKARWMRRHCRPGRLLEVGCGKGHFLVAAREFGYDVTGLEPDAKRAQHARNVFDVPVSVGFLNDNDLPTGYFDIVYHCDMLAHFDDPLDALRSMVDLLRPEGVLVFEVGILSGISPRWYKWVGQLGLDRHLWLYSPRSLELLFEKAHLTVLHRKRFGLAPYVLLPKLVVNPVRVVRRIIRQADTRQSESHRAALPSTISLKRRLNHHFRNFLRYRVGAMAPDIGPQTMFFVVRPLDRT